MQYLAFYDVGFGLKIIDVQRYEEFEGFLEDLSQRGNRFICLKTLDDDQSCEEWLKTKAVEEIKETAKELMKTESKEMMDDVVKELREAAR